MASRPAVRRPGSLSRMDDRNLSRGNRPIGVTALSIFFVIGAMLAGVAAASLAFPASVFEPMWRLNPRGHQGLVEMGDWGVLVMVTASLACGVSGIGLWRRRRWGYTVAMITLSVQLVGDILNVVSGAEPRAAVGIPIVSALLVYLGRPSVKTALLARGNDR